MGDGGHGMRDGGQGVSDGGQGMISCSHFSPLMLLAPCPVLVSSPALQPGNSPGANLWGLTFIYNPPKALPSFRGPACCFLGDWQCHSASSGCWRCSQTELEELPW